MGIHINRVIKSVVIYVVQVGALWGLLEGYTYFKGDALKEFLGPFWLLIYVLPLFTTTYIVFRESHEEEAVQENVTTQGDFSPGMVGRDYSVGVNQENTADSDTSNVPRLTSQETRKLKENISTEGHYSPGKVGGSYTVKMQSESLDNSPPADENSEVVEGNNLATKSDKNIHTKGNYSPGEVGGDYKIAE